MPLKPEHSRQFLRGPVFQGIFRRIEIQDELLGRVKHALPVHIAKHCHCCVPQEDRSLVIFTDLQTVASQLRFYAPSILAKLNTNQERPFKQILVRNLRPSISITAIKPMKPVSLKAIESVKASSKSAPCEELAIALEKLGATMERYAQEK